MFAIEIRAASASGVSGSPARSWPLLRQGGGSTASGSRDPGPVDDNRNMRRELGTSSDDEILRSGVLLRVPCAESRAGVSDWLASDISEFQQAYGVNCKGRSTSARLESHVPTVRGTTQKR